MTIWHILFSTWQMKECYIYSSAIRIMNCLTTRLTLNLLLLCLITNMVRTLFIMDYEYICFINCLVLIFFKYITIRRYTIYTHIFTDFLLTNISKHFRSIVDCNKDICKRRWLFRRSSGLMIRKSKHCEEVLALMIMIIYSSTLQSEDIPFIHTFLMIFY